MEVEANKTDKIRDYMLGATVLKVFGFKRGLVRADL
jgi:GTP cyclohydrolase II